MVSILHTTFEFMKPGESVIVRSRRDSLVMVMRVGLEISLCRSILLT